MPKLNESRADGKVWRKCDMCIETGGAFMHVMDCTDWQWPYSERNDREAVEVLRGKLGRFE